MSSLSRTASRLIARISLVAVALNFALFGAWTVGGLRGQPSAQKQERREEEDAPKTSPAKKKRIEEEEDTPRQKPKRKVIHVEEDEDAKPGTTPSAGAGASGDLAQLAKQASHPAVKALFRSLAVPYDLVLFKRSSVSIDGERRQREEKILPTPFYLGNDPGRYHGEHFRFTMLTKDWQPDGAFSIDPQRLEFVRSYEEIAQDKVRSFLRENYAQRERDDPLYLSRYEMLKVAEQVLSSVLRWHESAIQTDKRTGKEWEDVEKALRKQLLDEVLLKQMELLAQAQDWDKVLELTRRLAVTYTNDTERQRIFRPVADMIRAALNDPFGNEEKKQEARKRLHELEREFPDNEAFQPLRTTLQDGAKALLQRAEELARDKADPQKLQRAREYLEKAKEIWPQLPELRKFEIELGIEHPILRVGMRGLPPKYFSPAWACTDNEHRLVELLFESLVKLVPDGMGGFRYRPGLAEALPKVVRLGRQFQLPRNAHWSNRLLLNSTDIEFSLRWLKAGKGVGRSRVWGYLLDDVEPMKSPFQVTLRLKQGFLDPLAPMAFKILPRSGHIYTEAFAKNPVTSGPFRLDLERSGRSDETKRNALVFTANPDYGLRLLKQGTPHIQEIRFYSYAPNADIVRELNDGRLDLALDLTAKEAEELLHQQNADIEVPLPSPAVPNRRIYFLAINTTKLDDPKLRQALSCAIDREGLLNKYFRASTKAPLNKLHKVLNGPFPADSWVYKQNNADRKKTTLFNPEQAQLLMQQPSALEAAKAAPFKLKYAADDPVVDEVMKDLCAQVKQRTGVVLKPTPLTPYQLREDVEQTKNYDLAYYHYDFPDETYWLEPLLGPPPGMDDDKNIFKFPTMNLFQTLEATKSYRDFAKVRQHQWFLHEQLNREMPFIPLWQLDPLLAYRRMVQPVDLDPLLVFSSIEEWHLLHK